MEATFNMTIEYECECEGSLCEHAFAALKKSMQQAYDRGVEDGIKKAMEEVRSGLREAMAIGKASKYVEAKKPSKRKALVN